LAALVASAATTHAQSTGEQVSVDRTPVAPSPPATRLFTTPGGTLFAWTPNGLFRSDNGTDAWRPEPLPALPPNTDLVLISLDPNGQVVAYAGPPGKALLQATDGAWQPVNLPVADKTVVTLVPSPADPAVLYALTSGPWPPTKVAVRIYRSRDAGRSWEVVDSPCGPDSPNGPAPFSASGWIQPDASDAGRVFTSIRCSGSIGGGAPRAPRVLQSQDQGQSWSDFFRSGAGGVRDLYGDVVAVAGNTRPSAGVYLVAVQNDGRLGGSSVLRTVDDGRSWTEVLSFQGAAGISESVWNDLPNITAQTRLGFDPQHPEQIILGDSWASPDGGKSWGSVAGADLTDLAMTPNGLFAASSAGVLRLAVHKAGAQLADSWQLVAGGPAAALPRPVAIALGHDDSGATTVFTSYGVAQTSGVVELTPDGTIVAQWGPFNQPAGVAASADGASVFVNERSYPGRVTELAPDSATVLDGISQRPQGLAIDAGGVLYVTLQSRSAGDTLRLLQVSQSGEAVAAWDNAGSDSGELGASVWGIALDAANDVYVADTRNNRVQEFASDGTPVAEWDGLHGPCGVAVDQDGNVYVADTGASRVVKFGPDGTQLASWGDWGTGVGHFRWPMGVAVDASTGSIYIADTFNDRVVRISPSP
jgi:hypothetical protein